MGTLQLVASHSLAGKSTFTAAIALGLSRSGQKVRLARLDGDEAAAADAAAFSGLLFADAASRPVAASALTPAAAGETLIVEAPAGSAPLNAPAILVVRGAPSEGDIALARPLGERLLGTIATAVVAPSVEPVARDLTDSGLRPLAVVPEDRVIAAPTVEEIVAAVDGRLLYDGDNAAEVVEEVLIGPVYTDPARPHFRRFASKAILAPFNKTDLLLAAIETQAACLLITGGRQPSPYVIDRAQRESTTVVLTPGETPQTLSALSDVWTNSRFRGERKAEAALSHLQPRVDFSTLARRLST